MHQKGDIEIPLIPRGTSSDKNAKEYSDDNVIIPVKQPTYKPKHKSNFLEFLDPTSSEEKYAPRASFFKWLTFIDMLPYVKRMNLMFKKFDIADIPKPEKGFNVESKLIELDYQWMQESKKDKPSFSNALSRTFYKEIIQAIILSFLDNFTKIYYSIYMGKIINVVTSNQVVTSENTGELVSSATLLSMLVIISIFTKNWAFFTVVANTGRARLAISGLLYKKLNSTSLTALHELKLGKVINLLGNDLNDLQGLNNVLGMIVNPSVIALSTWMLWDYFGPSCLIGLVSLGLIIFVQICLSNRTEVPRKENKKTTDERVKISHEVIEGIRLIKMYAWEKLFKQKILRLRETEHATFRKTARIDAVGRNFSGMSVYLNILILCIFYTAVGGVLSPDKIYASMMILMYLGSSLVSSHQGRMALANFRMIMTRVEEVLNIEDVVDEAARKNVVKADINKPTVIYKNFTGYWTKTAQKPVLSDISFSLYPGTLTAVIGKIGCGKTSLLFSFLKELPIATGTADCFGKLGYVEQDPIIFSGTFRENILFGLEYDEALYKQVLQDCQLDIDLQNFPHGDQTRIGERGINLSGGQKARVSLARAFYSQSDIYLLDDPFSALDSTVARDLFNKLMRETTEKNKTTLLVTHHLHFAKEANHVILLSEGRIEGQGTFADLEKLNTSLLSIFKGFNDRKASAMSEDGEEAQEEEKGKIVDKVVSKTQEKGNREDAAEVSWKTYKEYFSVKGNWNIILLLTLLFVIPHTITVYFARVLGLWAEEQTRFNNDPENIGNGMTFSHAYYVSICLIMLLAIYVLSYAKSRVVNDFLLDTNSELHKIALDVLIRTKTLFFDINPVGRILNRFSNDLGALDKNNARMVFEFVDGTIGHVSLLATVCIINPAIIPPTFLVFYGLYRARMFFAKPMFLAKKLELASKSPVLSTIPATLQGLIIIRIYNQGGRFVREFMDLVYVNTKTMTFLTKTMRLFAFVLDTPIQLLTITGIWIFIVIMLHYQLEAGLLGLSLMYLLRIGSHSTQMIRQSLQIDINMQSAQRFLEYTRLPSEAADFVPAKDAQVEDDTKGQWPNKGEIVLNNVFLKYREELGFALKGLSLKIPGGLKIACVGRTGAGKSSIIQALFRMVEIETGRDYSDSSITIDGVDIGSIGLNLLRRKLSIIPQVPVVFADTIKKNLDPFGKLTDDELWKVLEDVGLKDYVASLPKKLETDMTVSSSVFSAGQKQLICLARVIISQSKVIILDEATANVDVETDHFIQKTIMDKFKDCTILTIAHRLITIANYDKVVVIDNGTVAEYDSPYALLVEQIGDSEITKKESMFADMVRSTGKSMAKKVFEVARQQYFKKKND